MALTREERGVINTSIASYKDAIRKLRGEIKRLESQKKPAPNRGAEIGKTKKR